MSEGGARIGVAYNEVVQLSVRYYPTEDPSLAETRSFSQPQREHAFELNGLASGTAYTIDLEARDGADLTNASALSRSKTGCTQPRSDARRNRRPPILPTAVPATGPSPICNTRNTSQRSGSIWPILVPSAAIAETPVDHVCDGRSSVHPVRHRTLGENGPTDGPAGAEPRELCVGSAGLYRADPKLRLRRPDIVYISSHPAASVPLIRQMRKLKLRPRNVHHAMPSATMAK